MLNPMQEVAEQLEALCRENFVLKTLLRAHYPKGRWKEAFLHALETPQVRYRYRGKIGGDVLGSLAQLRRQVDQDLEDQNQA
jgi:hypothetical protein